MEQDDHKRLILQVLQRVLLDYCYQPTYHTKQEDIETAHDFLFDDEYLIDWGGEEVSPEQLLDSIDLEIEYIRDRVRNKVQQGSQERPWKPGESIL